MAAESIAVIQATLAPAFLVSGTGIMLNFMQARLFRVLDRARAEPESPNQAIQVRRAHLLRNAIALGVLTVALTILAAICVMGGELFGWPSLGRAAPYAFAAAMFTLLTALCLVLVDTGLSVRFMGRR